MSDAPGVQIGKIRSMSLRVDAAAPAPLPPGNNGEARRASRARIQFWLPWTVLISPLWAT